MYVCVCVGRMLDRANDRFQRWTRGHRALVSLIILRRSAHLLPPLTVRTPLSRHCWPPGPRLSSFLLSPPSPPPPSLPPPMSTLSDSDGDDVEEFEVEEFDVDEGEGGGGGGGIPAAKLANIDLRMERLPPGQRSQARETKRAGNNGREKRPLTHSLTHSPRLCWMLLSSPLCVCPRCVSGRSSISSSPSRSAGGGRRAKSDGA